MSEDFSPPDRASFERADANEDTSLADVLERYGLQVSDEQTGLLAAYCDLLWEWNRKLNLTRHTDYDRFVSRDVLDSVRLARLMREGEEVLDIGTGGGVPGLLLAILRPDLQVSLSESVGKKARAVDDIVQQLQLPVPVYAARAEDLLDDFRFDTLVARAVGPLWKLCHWLRPHWHSFDRVLTLKGPRWVEERKEARHRGYLQNVILRRVDSYSVPGSESECVILSLSGGRGSSGGRANAS